MTPRGRCAVVLQMLRLGLISFALLAIFLVAGCGPTDKRIVFVSDRDGSAIIYNMSDDGSDVMSLPSGAGANSEPRWSPDRKYLAYLSQDKNRAQLNVMMKNGEEWDLCTVEGDSVLQYSWSPTGEHIAFLSGTEEKSDVYVTGVDCSNIDRVTYSDSPTNLGNWSNDEEWVVYSILEGDDQGVYLRNPNGVNRQKISSRPAWELTWAPKDERLAFLSRDEDGPRVWATDKIDRQPVGITNQVHPDSSLAWSPDAKRIAFVSERDGDPEIFTMKADGSDHQKLTNNVFADTDPAWSPNGKYIVFVSELHGNGEIFIMDKDGTNQKRLTNNEYHDTSPSW